MTEPIGRLLSDFKVAELKVELEKRGLSTQGIKVGLVERMSKWMIEKGLNPSTYLFEGTDSTHGPCSPSKASPNHTVAPPEAALSSTTMATEGEKQEEEEIPSKMISGDGKKEEEKKEEKVEEEKKEDEKDKDVIDVAKEKEMATRSIWLKNLKSGTKALEIKAMCMPIGHVIRAKMFTVKGKDSSNGLGGLGYVTFNTVEEADLAVLRLDKTSLKGVSVDVNKASPHNLPFLKTKKKDTPSVSITDTPSTTSNGASIGEKKEETKKEEKKKEEQKEKEWSPKKEHTSPTAVVVKEESKRSTDEEMKRPSIPPRFPGRSAVRTPVAQSNGGRNTNESIPKESRGSDKEKEELARQLAEKEKEHKKREDELILEKHKERVRYEREKLEKEKLRLQLDKMKAELAKGGARGEKKEERSGRDEKDKEKERNREREKEKERERERERKRERASYIAPATPQRVSRESYTSTRPSDRFRDGRDDRKREAHHPSRNPPHLNYRDPSAKRGRPSPPLPRRDNRERGHDIRSLSSSAFLPQGPSRSTYPHHMNSSGWTGGHNYNTALNPWASSSQPHYQRRY